MRASTIAGCVLLAGCYLSHEGTPDAPGGEDAPSDWSSVTTVFEPDAPRPVLQGEEHVIVGVYDGFLVFWVFNDGQLGIASARFDLDARVTSGPTVVVPAEPPLESSPVALAALRTAAGVRVYYFARRGTVSAVRVDLDGSPMGEPVVLADDASPDVCGVDIVHGGDRAHLGYYRDRQRVLVPVDTEGNPSGSGFVLYRRPDGEPSYGIGSEGERAHLTWADREPGGEDRLFHVSVRWDGSDATEPDELHAADNAIIGAPFFAEGRMWAERSDFETSSFVFRIDNPLLDTIVTRSPNRGSQWVVLPDGAAAVTGEADEPFTSSTRLVFRRMALEARRLLEEQTVADEGCDVEGYRTATGDGALAVSWVESCGERRLRVRVRRAP